MNFKESLVLLTLWMSWPSAGAVLAEDAVPAVPNATKSAISSSGIAGDFPESRWLTQRLEWLQDPKFGFMTHWAPYSQWGGIESWPLVEEDKFGRPDDLKAWTERDRDMARFVRDYWALPKTFNPVKFDPEKWAATAKEAGMKYVAFTTKHHDGFAMFDTKLKPSSKYRSRSSQLLLANTPLLNVSHPNMF